MKISSAGRELVARNEGLRLDAYPDPATGGDPWTIGYGDTGPDVVPGLTITKAEAERRLSVRLDREFGAAVNKAIGSTPTTQNEFDAMVSLAYNIGAGAIVRSSVMRHHVAGDHAAAANAFLAWNKAGRPLRVLAGLTRRRKEERALYLSGGAPAVEAPVDHQPTANPVEMMKDVQRALRDAGYPVGLIDGDPGTKTRQALNDYRARHAEPGRAIGWGRGMFIAGASAGVTPHKEGNKT